MGAGVPVARPMRGLSGTTARAWWSSRRRLVLLMAIIWLPMLVWWFALLPGGMSNDSLDQWSQIRSGHWTSHHPVADTAFVWLTSLGGLTPATTSFAQTLVVAAALGWFVYVVTNVIGGGRAVWVTVVLLAVLPFAGVFAVTIWKDVPEAAALVVLSGLLLLAWRGEEPLRGGWWVALGSAALATGLLRWNGGVTTVLVAVVVLIALRGRRRWTVAVTTAAAGLVGFGVLLLIPHVAPVRPIQPVDSMAQELADLAQFARDTPQSFSYNDRQALVHVAPFRRWRFAGHSCVSIDPITYRIIRYEGHEQALDANTAAIQRAWRHLVRKEPGEFLHARACRASLAWSFANPPRRNIVSVWPHVSANTLGLHQESPKPVRDAARAIADVSSWRWVQEMFWRPAVWVLLAVASASLAGLRGGRWRLLLLLLSVPLAALGSYAASPAAQDARYTYPATLICQLATVAYFSSWLARGGRLRRRLSREQSQPQAAEADGSASARI